MSSAGLSGGDLIFCSKVFSLLASLHVKNVINVRFYIIFQKYVNVMK